MTILDKFTKLT